VNIQFLFLKIVITIFYTYMLEDNNKLNFNFILISFTLFQNIKL